MVKTEKEQNPNLPYPEYPLPPKPKRWPTAQELREAELQDKDPVEVLRAIRREVPFARWETLSKRLSAK